MNLTTHERPGVYSSYDASTLVRGSGGHKTVGLAAINSTASAGVPITVTSYEAAVAAFGSQEGKQDMAELIRIALLNGAAAVVAVPVANEEGYQAAFDTLGGLENISVMLCDSTTLTVQQALRDSVKAASEARRERIAVVGGKAGENATALVQRAEGLNSERVVLTANAKKQAQQLTDLGFGALPICMAKTQYSFSDDQKLLGAPDGFTVTVRNIKVSAGAGFLVALTGDIMTMPGLPKVPAAEKVDVDENGRISGLF